MTPDSPWHPRRPGPAARSDIPPGWTEHDIASRTVIRRYLGNLVPALGDIYPAAVAAKLADILGVEDDYPELQQKPSFAQVPNLVLTDALTPLEPELDGDTKVFRVTIDEIDTGGSTSWRPPVKALGYNGQWPGPTIRVNQGDKVRAIFTNNLHETTGVHFHGVEFDDFFQDGVPFVTQKPIVPGRGVRLRIHRGERGLAHVPLAPQRHRPGRVAVCLARSSSSHRHRRHSYDREYIWISNDTLGGFTINGHGFPATVPVLAAQGERVLLRFMNEGLMMHPWHSHGFSMELVARDGNPARERRPPS